MSSSYDIALSMRVLDFIKECEGFIPTLYACSAVKPTVGFGHIIQKHERFGIFSGEFLLKLFHLLKTYIPNRLILNRVLQNLIPSLLTQADAQKLLTEDLMPIVKVIQEEIHVPLKQHHCDALVSLIHNIGITAFKESTLLKKINESDFTEAAKEFDRWIYVGKRLVKGLMIRRQKEKNIFTNVG